MALKESENPPMRFPEDVLTDPRDDETSWYVVYTKPRQEKSLAWDLKGRGLNYYLPLVKQKQKNTKRSRFSFIPLFTSYVFLKGSIKHRSDAFKTNRIVRILEVQNQELLIKELNIINTAINNGNVRIYDSKVQEGEKVIITEGPFKGIEGIVLESKNTKELIIQIESINQAIRVEIGLDKIKIVV